MQPKSKVCIFLGYSPTQNAYKCFEPQTKKFFLSRHVLFNENLTHSSLSQTTSSVTTQPTRESHNSFSLFFFNAQQVVMSPSQLSDAPTSSLPPKGPPAIIASSSGNFGLSVSFLHDFLQTLDHNTTRSNFPRTGSSLNLQSQSHDSSHD